MMMIMMRMMPLRTHLAKTWRTIRKNKLLHVFAPSTLSSPSLHFNVCSAVSFVLLHKRSLRALWCIFRHASFSRTYPVRVGGQFGTLQGRSWSCQNYFWIFLYSNFRNYAPPPFLPQICPPFFWGQFSQNSLVGDAWLKASLVLQHSLYYPLKNWALLVPKYGRAVKSIYSYNLFSSFATKKWYFYRKYAPPPDTAWLQLAPDSQTGMRSPKVPPAPLN